MDVKEFEDSKYMSQKAAERIAELYKISVKEKGFFTLVLSGGSSPRAIYEKLAQEPIKSSIDWNKVYVFWGDERYIERTNNDSNYRMANKAFISKVPLPEENIFPVPVEKKPAEKAAEEYENTIKKFFKEKEPLKKGVKFPKFDLILLGVGVDGHTASLFPGNVAVNEKKRWVVRVKAHARVTLRARITMTMPVLNNGKNVMFIISGHGKGQTLKSIFEGPEKIKKQYPASVVALHSPRSVWYIDKHIYE